MCADSTRCFSTFCPYDVRYCSRPRSLIISGWMSVMPTSATASSPARRICSSSSRSERSWTSSIRAGWMRPSATSFSSVIRAASRRTGSKHDSTTASGVSSMIRFTPVVASNARMFRPSRPMIRPFMSSLGSANTDTVDSAVCSEATRWIAIVTILRARSSPSSRARCSISRTWVMAARFASSTTWATRCSRASLDVMPAIRSSCGPVLVGRLLELLAHELELLVPFLQLERPRLDRRDLASGGPSPTRAIRLSRRAISSRRARTSSSASRRMVADLLVSLLERCLTRVASASRSASRQGLLGAGFDALRIGGRHRSSGSGIPRRSPPRGRRCRPVQGPSFLPTHVERVVGEEPRKVPPSLGAGVREGGHGARSARWRSAPRCSRRSSVLVLGQLAHRASWMTSGSSFVLLVFTMLRPREPGGKVLTVILVTSPSGRRPGPAGRPAAPRPGCNRV